MLRTTILLLACLTLSRSAARAGEAHTDASEVEKMLAKLPAGYRHEQHTMMPLRDGVKLATDIFLPPGNGPWPVMLLRTSYSRFDHRPIGGNEKLALVCQNSRSRYGSEGTTPFESFDNEVEDGYDAVEWVAKQPWCTGRVGMWGPSGHGMAAINGLWSNAPHLAVVDVNVTFENAWRYILYHNGVRREVYSWLTNRNQKVSDWPKPTTSPFDLAKRDAWVKERAAACKTAFIGKAGWFDLFSEATLDTFGALAHTGRCYASVSAKGHGPTGGLQFKSKPWPKGVMERTAAQWLLEGDPKLPPQSVLVYHLMGDANDPAAPGNQMQVAHTWPVDHTPTSWHFRPDGRLTREPPSEKEASVSYEYDPRNPVTVLGGHHFVGDKSGAYDQRPLKERKDILRFSTDPLAEPVGITGKVWVELHVSTDVTDTAFTAKLVDVYPDGYEAVMRESAMLARYHQGLDKPAPLEKGKTYALMLDCWSTALVFNTGHRIAVHVSSSSAGAFEVHPNSYEPVMSYEKAPVAHQTVHCSATHASRVILPVIPKEAYIGK